MRNLKKVLAVVLALSMLLSLNTVAFAASTSADDLTTLGLLDQNTDEQLSAELTRVIGVVMILKSLGYTAADADAVAADSTFTDLEGDYAWAKGWVQLAYNEGITLGKVDGEIFDPAGALTSKEFVTFQLRALGYADAWANVEANAEEAGLDVDVEATTFTKAEAADVMFAALSADLQGEDAEGTLLDKLIADGLVTEEAAIEVGVITKADLEINSAKALNEAVIQVALNEDVDAPSVVSASDFEVVQGTDAIAVDKAVFAPWDADNYTVLVYVSDDLEAGKLYKVESGETSANFGGKSADTDEPTVKSVTSTDYNEVTVVFSEAVLLETVSMSISEKYGDKDDLAITDMAYDGAEKIVFTTDEQGDATLYATEITDAEDLAGNVMDDEDSQTFVGQDKPTSDLEVDGAKANDYNEVAVLFNMDVDPDTVSAENFTITEKYGDKKDITVLDAVVAADDDEYYGDNKIEDSSVTDADQYVILTVEDLEDATLYVIKAEDVASAYDTDLDSDNDETTFVGISKPDGDFKLVGADAVSNTEVDLTFERKVDESMTDLGLYTITEKYGDKDDLAVSAVEVDGKTVTLTVESMDNVLYEVEVSTDLGDIYGNFLDSDNDITTFVGEEVADEIDSLSISRLTDTTIAVIFGENVGDNATDVAFYNINGGVGYPESAVKADDDDVADYTAITSDNKNKTIILTIPETTDGKVYTLTVAKGLENADGIETTDELEKTFTGAGSAAGLPEIEAVMALDDQTLKIYFDRDVDDSKIKGKIWNTPGDNNLAVGALGIDTDNDETIDSDLASFTEYAYQSPESDDILIVRLASKEFEKADSTASNNTFNLIANTSLVESDDDANILEFNYNDDNPSAPELESAVMLNNETLRLYFSEPVDIVTVNNILVLATSENTGSQVARGLSSTSDDDIVFDIALTGAPVVASELTNDIAYVYFVDGTVQDITNTVNANDADDSEVFIEVAVGADYDAADEDKITDVFAYMPDNRTIKVQYPEAMDADEATDTNNYRLVTNSTGTTGASTTTVDFQIDTDNDADTGYSEYDSDTYTVTLFLDADINDLDLSKYYLAVDTDVDNKLGTNEIDADETSIATLGSGIVFEFAVEADDPATPELASASVSDDRYELTIKFDQKMNFVENGVTAFDDTADTLDTVDNILNYVDITAQFESETSAGAITATDVADAQVSANDKEVTITFQEKLKASTSGTVTTEDQTAVASKAGKNTEVDSDASEVTFGVATSLYDDGIAPALISGGTPTIAAGATTTVVFSEILSSTSKTAVQNQIDADTNVTAGNFTYTWSGSVLTIKNVTAGSITVAADVSIAVSDSYNNTSAALLIIDLP